MNGHRLLVIFDVSSLLRHYVLPSCLETPFPRRVYLDDGEFKTRLMARTTFRFLDDKMCHRQSAEYGHFLLCSYNDYMFLQRPVAKTLYNEIVSQLP